MAIFHYIGMTSLKHDERPTIHKALFHTRQSFVRGKIDAVVAVNDKSTAASLKQYFKSGADRTFASKYLFPTVPNTSAY